MMYVCIYDVLSMNVFLHAYRYIYMKFCMNVPNVHVCKYICMYVRLYVYIFLSMFVCIFLCTYCIYVFMNV